MFKITLYQSFEIDPMEADLRVIAEEIGYDLDDDTELTDPDVMHDFLRCLWDDDKSRFMDEMSPDLDEIKIRGTT
jgi:hypothetical protein